MWGPSAFRMAICLLSLALVVSATRPAAAGAFDLNDATWEGCAELLDLARAELGRDRVVVLSTLDWGQVEAGDGILVLHPEKPMDAEEAASFMKAGGRMAILDDFGRGEKLLEHFKIRRRTLPTQPLSFLRSNPALAIATPAYDTSGGELLGLHPTVGDVKQVVLNHATALEHPDLTPVLEVRVRGDDPVAVAVAGQIDGPKNKGRLFAMGDPSAFINLMLRYPGNRAFASGLVHYLADGDATDSRQGRLFVVANEFGERGSFGGITPLRKTIDRKIEAAVEAFEELRDEGFPWWLHVAVAVAAAMLVLWWVGRALVRLYTSRVPRFARALPLVAQGGVAGRAAVLASEVSPPALALLEIRSALVEALASHFGVHDGTPARDLVEKAAEKGGVPPELGARARSMLESMRAAEDALVAGTPARVSRDEVRTAADITRRILAAAGIDPVK